MGPTALAPYKIGMGAAIPGTRTAARTFDRTAGVWTVDALIGQFAFFYDSANPNPRRTGEWHEITDNDANTITVDADTTVGVDTVEICAWNPLSETMAHGESASGAYAGCCFDGRFMWFAPRFADDILKIDTLNWDYEKIPHGEGAQAFEGCVFDGEFVWMIPHRATKYLKIHAKKHTIVKWAHGIATAPYCSGATFDGENIWIAPRGAPLIRLNVHTHETTEYPIPSAANSYATVGANFDGKYIWLVPDGGTANIYKIDPANPGNPQSFAKGDTSWGYSNSIFDGVHLWLIPFLTTDTPLTKIHVTTGIQEYIDVGAGYTFHHHDGCFDGESLWLTPYNSEDFIKLDPYTHEMTKYPHGQGDSAFAGCLFDGRSIWWTPYKSANVIRMFPPRFGYKKPWDQDTITTIAAASGVNEVTMPRDTVRVTSSDGGGASVLVLHHHQKARPKTVVVENDTANSIDIDLNPDGGGVSTITVATGNAVSLHWSNASTGLYKYVALT